MIFLYNPWSFTPNLPQLPNQLVQGLKDLGVAYAINWKNNTVHNPESFNWISSDVTVDEIFPTHGNFAGPGYGAGKRNPILEYIGVRPTHLTE